MLKLESLAALVVACASCGVLHAAGYRCSRERKIARLAGERGLDGARTILAKGTK